MNKYYREFITHWTAKFMTALVKAKFVGVDTETVSLEDKTLVGYSIAFNDEAYYIPVRDKVLPNMPIKQARELLQTILHKCIVIFHNSSFDLPVLHKFGIDIESSYSIHDTLLMANLVNENMRHGLKKLTKKYFNYEMTEYKEICGTGKKQIAFADAPQEKYNYACDDAFYTLKLYHLFVDKLVKDRAIEYVYTKIERPLLHVIADMHSGGITINVEKVKEIKDKCEHIVKLAEDKLRIEMGDINFSSSQQLKNYFIDQRHMPVIKQSDKTGRPSMDKEVLEKYAETDNVAKTLLEFRKYSKILTTFIPALWPADWNYDNMTGKIHASFN